MKFKGFSGVKIHEGERYVFIRGKAIVPCFRFRHQVVSITLKEFKQHAKATVS